jgi:hypothetical protein
MRRKAGPTIKSHAPQSRQGFQGLWAAKPVRQKASKYEKNRPAWPTGRRSLLGVGRKGNQCSKAGETMRL